MKVRNRILYVRQNDGEEGKGLFARVLRDLHEALREKTGRARGFVDWPNVNWREGDLHCQVSCWYSDENQDERLVQVKLTEQVGDVTWITEVTIGTVRDDQVIVWEVCETSDRVPIPVDDAPAVLDFLASYSCEDVDGYPTGKVLVVEQHQASSFALFVKALSEDRRLPIILVSPRLYNDEYTLQNVRKLAAQLRGMAHVIRLSDKTKWFGQHLPLKAYTVDGSVRIYLPGYGEDESSRRHRLWSHTHIQKLGLEETADEITQEVYQHNANFSFEDAALAGLLAARDRQIRRRKLESERSAEQARRAQNLAVLHQRIKTQILERTLL